MVDEPMVAFEQQRISDDATMEPALLATSVTAPADAAVARPLLRNGRSEAAFVAATAARLNGRMAEVAPAPLSGRRLAEAIECALVPRLLNAHGAGSGVTARMPDAMLTAEVDAFIILLLADGEEHGETGALARLQARGATVEALCLDLLAPAARRLGEMWEDDVCDFATVTLGLSRLHRALHELHPVCAPGRMSLPVHPLRVAVLAAAPGEQHVFGIAMVGEFLRSAGWEVHDAIGLPQGELAALVRHHWFAVAALSTSRESGLEALAGTVRALRAASCHRAIGVLVGGRIFTEQPGAVTRVGADATASDARSAIAQAERLLARADSTARFR